MVFGLEKMLNLKIGGGYEIRSQVAKYFSSNLPKILSTRDPASKMCHRHLFSGLQFQARTQLSKNKGVLKSTPLVVSRG